MHGVKMAMEDSLDGGMLFSRTELTTPLCTLNDSQQNPFTSPPRQVLLPLSPRTAKMVTLTPLHFGQYDDPQELTKGLHQMMKTFNELSSQQSQELAQVKRHLEALNKQPDQGVPDTIWVEELYCLDGERDELPDYLYLDADPRTALFIEEFSDDEEDTTVPAASALCPELNYLDLDDDLDEGYLSHLEDDDLFLG